MPSVDELLNMAEVAEATLTETNDVIEIDADTRTMIIPDTERIFGVMSDEKGERKYFRCKRFVGNGIDLSKLDLRVIYQNASGLESGRDKYIVTDLATDGEDYVTFSWELSRKVTAYKGIISFIVCAIKTGTDGIVTNEWNTTLANGIVLDGLEVSGTQEQEKEAYDYYKQLEAELEKKAQEVIGTIPSDYTQTLKDVGNLKGEVTDGRTDVDGEVHKNIGDAMRGQARKLRGNLVVRQKEQPTDPNNNVWISDEDNEVEVPDMGEFNSLKEDKVDKPSVADNNKIPRAKDGDVEWVEVGQPTDEQTSNAVKSWLNEHPEATTTVQDKSLTETKFTDQLKTKTIKDYVTPEMFGAKGDWFTDDTQAVQSAFDSGYNVMLVSGYVCRSTVIVNDAKQRTISGFNINKSALLFKDSSQLIIGSDSNVNELRMNNMSVTGDGTQDSVLKIQNVTNVYLNQVNIAEGGMYLLELDHADIVFMNGCIFAGSNKQGVWQPCAGIKLTSANPVFISNCNIWNVTNAFEIIGTTRVLNIFRNWIEFVKCVVHASNVEIINCNLEVSQNSIVFSVHGDVSHLDSRIVKLDTILTGFDITVNVTDNWINYYTTHPTEALVELKSVPSFVNVNILRNNMFTRLSQMNAYALKVDAGRETKLNYESTTDADKKFGCATASVLNKIVAPRNCVIKNLNLSSDQKQKEQNDGDIWFSDDWFYVKNSSGVKSLVISQAEAIANIKDTSTATIEDVATKLNELLVMLRKTKVVR